MRSDIVPEAVFPDRKELFYPYGKTLPKLSPKRTSVDVTPLKIRKLLL